MVDLTKTPDVDADARAGKNWLGYAVAAGLAGAAFSLGQSWVGEPVSGAVNSAVGSVVGQVTDNDPTNDPWSDW